MKNIVKFLKQTKAKNHAKTPVSEALAWLYSFTKFSHNFFWESLAILDMVLIMLKIEIATPIIPTATNIFDGNQKAFAAIGIKEMTNSELHPLKWTLYLY